MICRLTGLLNILLNERDKSQLLIYKDRQNRKRHIQKY